MKTNQKLRPLIPTIWRTCRALANRRRLRIFQTLLANEGLTVTELAEKAGCSESIGSRYLRQINARGLLQVKRVGPYVFYSIGPDASVHHTSDFLEALVPTIEKAKGTKELDAIFKALTAYTHPNRLAIVRSLDTTTPVRKRNLMSRCHLSDVSLDRNLAKLGLRNLVRCTRQGVFLTIPPDTFAQKLLAIVRA